MFLTLHLQNFLLFVSVTYLIQKHLQAIFKVKHWLIVTDQLLFKTMQFPYQNFISDYRKFIIQAPSQSPKIVCLYYNHFSKEIILTKENRINTLKAKIGQLSKKTYKIA